MGSLKVAHLLTGQINSKPNSLFNLIHRGYLSLRSLQVQSAQILGVTADAIFATQ